MFSDTELRRYLSPAKVALLGDLIRWSTWAAVLVVWVSFGRAHARLWWTTATEPWKNDYSIFYYTAQMIADGLPMYGKVPPSYGGKWPLESLGNLNPPHFQLLTSGLPSLSYAQAGSMWIVGGLVCLVGCVLLVWRELKWPVTARLVMLVGAGVVASAPFVLVSSTGELTYYLMVPFTLAWRASRRHRWGRAGMWLGVCASLKLFLLLFLPWLAIQRRWRGVFWFVASLVVATGLGVVTYGVASYQAWFDTLKMIRWWGMAMNASLAGLTHRTIAEPAIASGVATIGALLICTTTLFVLRRRPQAEPHVDVAFLGLLSAALLASPLGWAYYVPLALGPSLACIGTICRMQSARAIGLAVAVLGIFYVPDETLAGFKSDWTLRLTVGSLYFWGLLTVWMSDMNWYGSLAQTGSGRDVVHHGNCSLGERAQEALES